jgi:hypothetical protein
MLYPRAADWRSIARALPHDLRKQALAREDHIASLLADKTWPPCPHWPDSEAEKRFTVRYFNAGVSHLPQYPKAKSKACITDVDHPDFCGPVVWHNGKPVARSYYDEGRIVASDVVDKLGAATSSDDLGPPFSLAA